jgi:hypothetical protein
MEKVVKAGLLIVGRKFYKNGPYGGPGMIVAVNGKPGAVPIGNVGGVMFHGGSATVDVVIEGRAGVSKAIPECIVGSGAPWVMSPEVASAEEVAEAIASAAILAAEEKAKDDEKAARFALAREAAKAEGLALGLIPEAEFKGRGTAAAHNLRKELKAQGIKVASLRGDYDSINVRVAEADLPAVKAIAAKYEAGHFDGMSDCYEYHPSAWGSVFGDVKYVFEGVA